jgi:tripartite-type tricarboxylate transporter receptor subunit TctC
MKYKKYLAAALLALCNAGSHASDAYPTKPIRLIIPYAAGGTTDIIGRVLTEKLTKSLGGNIIVENKAGANSMIGTSYVARSPADGYTLLLTSDVVVINEFLYKKPTYSALNDLTPIAPVVTTPYFFMVNGKLPMKSVGEFVTYAKANPGKVAFGSSGTGGTPHLVGELFQQRTGTKLLHVAYKGTGPAAIDLASGQVQAMFVGLPAVDSLVRDGAIRVLAAAEDERSPQMPQVPTIKEAGFSGVTASNWFGLLGPAGLPPEVVKRVSEATAEIAKTDDFRKRMEALGAVPMVSTSQAFDTLYKEDRERWGELIKSNNLTLDQQ